ncbi:hypothetical protein LJC48_02690 [Desulfovibrio sp. OttesenSCG-928-C06]|nr:hypothetical protein [Desulfovibrio sp. OttesenSCG-928-C06]
MRLKESVILALKLAHREKRVIVVGREDERWIMLPLEDSRSDLLQDSFIVTPKGLRYPEDEARLAELVSQGW